MGKLIRTLMATKKITFIAAISVSISRACLSYLLLFKFLNLAFGVSSQHEHG